MRNSCRPASPASRAMISIHIPTPLDPLDDGHDHDVDNHDMDGAFESPRSPRVPRTPSTPSGGSGSTSGSAARPRELAPFLRQLREMLDHESPSILRWTPDGRAFEILDLHQMTHVVLPKYFKHTKYASFQRQLNYFHFRKWTKSKSPRCTFANPHFVREAPELTWQITRKRDASQRQQQRLRQRAQSFDPAVMATATASATATVQKKRPQARSRSQPWGAPAATATTATTATATGTATGTVAARDRAASESSLAYGTAEPTDGGLLQWIDTQFPSIASLALLDDDDDGSAAAATAVPPVWTPYAPQRPVASAAMALPPLSPPSPVPYYV